MNQKNFVLAKKKKKLKKKSIFALGFAFFAATAIIAIPLVTVANLKIKDPTLQVQNQAKLISNISLKDQYLTANSSYFDIKKQLFNEDNTKKTGVDFSQFFDFYQRNDANLPINFATDYDWSRFKLEVFDLKPLDQEQSFEVYYRLLQDLPNKKTAISDLYKQKVPYNYFPDYSLSNFATNAEEKLKKLRPYSNQEFNFSTKKQLTKLITVDDFHKKVNSSKNSTEAEKIISQYFNLSEIFDEILGEKNSFFVNEKGVLSPRYEIKLTKDPILNQEFLAKTAQKDIYKLTFYASFSPSFIKEIASDTTKNSKFHFGVNVNLANIFLDNSIVDNIKLTEFSDNDYFSTTNLSQNSANSVNGWDFLNYYNNQVFATKGERETFLNSLVSKIVKTPIISKVKFENQLSGLDYAQVSKFLNFEIKLDPDATKLGIENNKVVAKIAGKILVKDQEDKIIAEKQFSQKVANLESISQNDSRFASKIKKSEFKFEPKVDEWISGHAGVPREEILTLIEQNKFDKLKKVLENPRYYGYRFNEDRLKLMVDNYKLPTVEEFIKNTQVPENKPEGIVSMWTSSLKNSEEINRFFASLAKKDIEFVAKFWFDFLKHFKLLETESTWPSDIKPTEFFKKLSEIKFVDPTKGQNPPQQQSTNKKFWLFSFNNDYLITNEKLENSFYLHEKLKNTLNLMKNNSTFDSKYFVEQIQQISKQIDKGDFIAQKNKNPIESLTDFLAAFYSLVYSKEKDQRLFTESLGENFDYKIQFRLDTTPVLATVDGLQSQKDKLKLKYWYNIGPVDEKGNLISVVHKTSEAEINLAINDGNKLLTEDIEKLDEIAKEFPTSDQFVFLTEQDYKDIHTQLKTILAKVKVNEATNVDSAIKKLPFSQFFKLNYPNYGFYAKKEETKTTETAPVAPAAPAPAESETTPKDIPGVIENWSSELGNQVRYNLSLYVYHKDFPDKVSTKPIRVIIIISSTSLLSSVTE